MQGPDFDLDFKPAHGEAVTVADGVQRITVNNPGPFTFHGTNSYIVGSRSVAVIDPGPEDEAHFQALMTALKGREVTHIAVSHTHRDHSPLARRLKAATGATIVGEGPHRAARPLHEGEINPFAESSDMDFSPDIVLADGGPDRRRRLGADGARHARPHRQPHGVCARRHRHGLFRRSRHGLGDDDRRTAGWRDGRLHGLAGKAADA